MTIQNTAVESNHIGNGASVTFAYEFKVYEAGHVRVRVDGVVVPQNEVTVSGVGNDSGGSVTLQNAPSAGAEIRIYRRTPKLQLTDYQAYGRFPAETHELRLDYLTAMIQEVADDALSTSYANGRGLRADLRANGYNILNVGNISVESIDIAGIDLDSYFVKVGGNISDLANDAGYLTADDLGSGPDPAVVTVFGRSGAVVAAQGDYNTNLISNTSSVSGSTLTAALDGLLSAIPDISGKMDKAPSTTVDAIVTQDANGNARNSGVTLSSLSNLYAGILHTHAISDIGNLQPILDNKANVGHTHDIFYVNGLQDALDSKASANHVHVKADIVDFSDADYATAAQGSLANTALQPNDLATVATTGAYSDLTGIPVTFPPSAHTHTLSDITDAGTAASSDVTDFVSSNVRKSLLDSPLCRLFVPNKVVVTLAGALTSTRASTATYVDRYGVVKTAANDELREEKEGWLIEGASTNLVLHSEDFSDASWAKTDVTIATNAAAAPDGTTTADRVTDNATLGVHRVFRSISLSSVGQFTLSFFAKAETLSKVILHSDILNASMPSSALFDLSNGTVTGGTNAKIEPLANGWYRCSAVYTSSDTLTAPQILLAEDSSLSYSGTGKSLLLWGAQVEALPFASSYIPTTTAPATRVRDVITAPVSNNFVSGNQGDWSFSVIFRTLGYRTAVIFSHNGTTNQNVSFSVLTGSSAAVYARDFDFSLPSIATYTEFEQTSFAAVRDGANLTSYSQGIAGTPTQPVEDNDFELTGSVRIGAQENNGNEYYGHIRDFRIYDFALNADEVQFLAGVK